MSKGVPLCSEILYSKNTTITLREYPNSFEKATVKSNQVFKTKPLLLEMWRSNSQIRATI
jgi:hypothetical protein